MDTQLLEAFLAVAETGSFSLAADKVHLTQPAISKRVAQLESQLETRLFDRIARTTTLTEAGRALLPRAERILQELTETRQAIRDLSGDVAGRLRLAISHHIGLHRLPALLKDFAGRYAEVTVDVEFMDSEVAYEAILHGKFEVAVITLSPEQHPRIVANTVWSDPLLLVVSADHPLSFSASVRLPELCQYPAILPGENTYTGRMIKQAFTRKGINLQASMATNYLETIKMLVSVGLGWSMLPTTMMDASIAQLHCPGMHLSRKLGYIHHREKTLSNAARAFIQLLEEEKKRQ